MNNKLRKRLSEAVGVLRNIESSFEKAKIITDGVYDSASDSLENYPENLQFSEAYEKMEDDCDSLDEIRDKIDDAQEGVGEIISEIEKLM